MVKDLKAIISIKVPHSLYEWAQLFIKKNNTTLTRLCVTALNEFVEKNDHLILETRPEKFINNYHQKNIKKNINKNINIRIRISMKQKEWLRNYIYYLSQRDEKSVTLTKIFIEALNDYRQNLPR